MKRVVTIGSVMKDIFIQTDGVESLQLHTVDGEHAYTLFEEGKKIEVGHVEHHVGGGAANSAVSFARLGFEVSTIAKMGTDADAEFITHHLKSAGVHEQFFIYTNQACTGTSFIIPSSAANRTILVYRGANKLLAQTDIPADAFNKADLVYITSLTQHAADLLPYITQQAHKQGLFVAVNPGTSQLRGHAVAMLPALAHIDLLILNAYEAGLLMQALQGITTSQIPTDQYEYVPELLQGLTNSFGYTLPDFVRVVMQKGPRILVVTNGKEGVYVAAGNKLYFHKTVAQQIISTVGAGDSFASTFVALHALNIPIEQAIHMSLVNCASVLEHIGAQTGLLTMQELENKTASYKTSIVHIYNL